jgi:hypothetical protein
MNKRLATALAAYAALSVAASLILHGKTLGVVLILFGYFAVRTAIADKIQSKHEPLRDESSQPDTQNPDSESEPERR